MKLKWSNIYDIAIELEENYPEEEILALSFTKFHQLIVSLPNFIDNPENSNEGILEAIQMAWIEERN
jgi:FeS assembly protein IscX